MCEFKIGDRLEYVDEEEHTQHLGKIWTVRVVKPATSPMGPILYFEETSIGWFAYRFKLAGPKKRYSKEREYLHA